MARIHSGFSVNTDSWTISGDGVLSYDAAGGSSGGALKGVDQAQGVSWHFEAPDKFEGDLLGFFGGALSFQQRRTSGTTYEDFDVIIEGANEVYLVFDTVAPGTNWSTYSISLDSSSGWRLGSINGALASDEDIRSVLADVTRVAIRGEHVSGADTGWLDAVTLRSDIPVAVQSLSITSDFARNAEDWTAVGDTQAFGHQGAGGNPGGYLRGADAATGAIWHYSTPEEYLGNKSDFYGGMLGFDLRLSASTDEDVAGVVISGGGLTLVRPLDGNLDDDWWISQLFLRTGENWRVGSADGAAATEAQIRQVLANVDELLIRGEYVTGADEGALDNVVLMAPGAESHSWRIHGDDDEADLRGVCGNLAEAIGAADNGDQISLSNPYSNDVDVGLVAVSRNALVIRGDLLDGVLQLEKKVIGLELEGLTDLDIKGNGSANVLYGGEGRNLLKGGGGGDELAGSEGRDVLYGNKGFDTLIGGLGADKLNGAAGEDLFQYLDQLDSGLGAERDQIVDFVSGEDQIDLRDIYAGTIAFIGSQTFSGSGSAELRVINGSAGQKVSVDLDGDGDTDFELLVLNNGVTGEADFLL